MENQEQQMDQLMARLTVVQQQLMSVWAPGLQTKPRMPMGNLQGELHPAQGPAGSSAFLGQADPQQGCVYS